MGTQTLRPEDWPLVRSVISGVNVLNEEIDVDFEDGTTGVLRISSAAVRRSDAPDAPITGAVAICEDITGERAQAEERLQVGFQVCPRSAASVYLPIHMTCLFMVCADRELRVSFVESVPFTCSFCPHFRTSSTASLC